MIFNIVGAILMPTIPGCAKREWLDAKRPAFLQRTGLVDSINTHLFTC
jgi:hypothetical protein